MQSYIADVQRRLLVASASAEETEPLNQADTKSSERPGGFMSNVSTFVGDGRRAFNDLNAWDRVKVAVFAIGVLVLTIGTPMMLAMMIAGAIGTPFDDNFVIVKPITDYRQYRYIPELFSGGPPMLAISDPGTLSSGISIGVQTGSYYDTDAYPGTAHFLEHLVFLGSSVLPSASSYTSFVTSHGGSFNAFTDSEKTVYYTSINQADFGETVSRLFSSVFFPTLSPASAATEVAAVDSEHAMHISDPDWRIAALVESLALSPVNKYSSGDSSTLTDSSDTSTSSAGSAGSSWNPMPSSTSSSGSSSSSSSSGSSASPGTVMDALKTFHASNYCYSRAVMVALSSSTVVDLVSQTQATVLANSYPSGTFSSCDQAKANFTATSTSLIEEGGYPIPLRNRMKFIYSSAPQSSTPRLSLAFSMPSYLLSQQFSQSVFSVLTQLIMYRGANGLVSVLTEVSGLATSLRVSRDESSAGKIVYVHIYLTPAGRAAISAVTGLVLQYISCIAYSRVTSDLLTDFRMVQRLRFNASESMSDSPFNVVRNMASALTDGSPPKYVLLASSVLRTVDPSGALKVLDAMNFANMVAVFHDPMFQQVVASSSDGSGTGSSSYYDPTEPVGQDPHYGTLYQTSWFSAQDAAYFKTLQALVSSSTGPSTVYLLPDGTTGSFAFAPSRLPALPSNYASVFGQFQPVSYTMVSGSLLAVPQVVSASEVLGLSDTSVDSVVRPILKPSVLLANSGVPRSYVHVQAVMPDLIANISSLTAFDQLAMEAVVEATNYFASESLADYALSGYDWRYSGVYPSAIEFSASLWDMSGTDVFTALVNMLVGLPRILNSKGTAFVNRLIGDKIDALNSTDRAVSEVAGEVNAAFLSGVTFTRAELLSAAGGLSMDSLLAWYAQYFQNVQFVVYGGGSSSMNSTSLASLAQLVSTTAISAGVSVSSSSGSAPSSSPSASSPSSTSASVFDKTLSLPSVKYLSNWVEARLDNPAASDTSNRAMSLTLLFSSTASDPLTYRQRALMQIVGNILDARIFYQVRTVKQMGYIATARFGVFPSSAGTPGVRIYVQGNVVSPDDMQSAAEEVISGLVADFDVTDDELTKLVAGATTGALSLPSSPLGEVDYFWPSVRDHRAAACYTIGRDVAKALSKEALDNIRMSIVDLLAQLTDSSASRFIVKVFPSGSTRSASYASYLSSGGAASIASTSTVASLSALSSQAVTVTSSDHATIVSAANTATGSGTLAPAGGSLTFNEVQLPDCSSL